MGQFIYVIRKRIKLRAEQAIFVFVNGKTLPPTGIAPDGAEVPSELALISLSFPFLFYVLVIVLFCFCENCENCVSCFVFGVAAVISALYKDYKDEDGFLYMAYSGESTFGI